MQSAVAWAVVWVEWVWLVRGGRALERPPAWRARRQEAGAILHRCSKCSSNKLPSRCRVVRVLELAVWEHLEVLQSQRHRAQLAVPLLDLACREPGRVLVLVLVLGDSSRSSEREEVEVAQV